MSDTKTCACHANAYNPCDYPGGCGSRGGCCGQPDGCRSAERCTARTPEGPYPTSDPLCLSCLGAAARDVRSLIYDYLDLAQLHEASLSQAITEKTGGSKDSPMLISGHVEALQAEIVHVTTTWELEVRAVARLSEAPVNVRAGAQVQHAVNTLGPRLPMLSRLPATTVYRTGCEDTPADVEGWEAVHHLQALHARARATLGRTKRTFWIPGECWACAARPTPGAEGPLYRSEPRFADDPMQVDCDRCHATRPYPDYEQYMATLLWPDVATDANVRVAA